MKRLAVVLLCILALSACSTAGNTDAPQNKPAAAAAQTRPEKTKPHRWLIEVTDTKKGVYNIPETDKSFDYSATLHLIAWKDGGDRVPGNYTGRWLIHFDVDYAKLSGDGIKFAGNVMQDRLCNKMSFTILPYSIDGYAKIRKVLPGSVSIQPLVKMDGMSSFTARETPVKREDWKAFGNGGLLHAEDSSFASGEKIPVGANLLTRQDEVTVEIPTYSLVWKLGSFTGKITKNSNKDPNQLFNDILSANAKKMRSESTGSGTGNNAGSAGNADESGNGNGGYTTDSQGRKGFDTNGDGKADTWYDKDGNMRSDAIKGAYITDSEGHEGLDINGDGKLDMWMDEDGNTHIDYNKDGKMEIIKGEYDDGN